ncbi:MAG: DUF4365 domain-containing protein [Candidatus Cloacimonetes bacterium]|nr:DUF4365 domain-containing protein [Candidatus Cloacimonadota bacterium]
MQKRTKEHILEDKSKNVFRTLLPENWLFREKSHDYGIDGEIEIFDTDNKTTGLMFYIQLKATDSKGKNTIHKIRMKSDTIRYF